MRKLLMLFALSFLVLNGCSFYPSDEEFANADYGPYPSNYTEIFRAGLIDKLYDPYSAQFHFKKQPQKTYHSNDFGITWMFGWGGTVYMNAKNQLGGYTGAQPYKYFIKNNRLLRFDPQ